MAKTLRWVVPILLAAASASAQTQVTKVENGSASVYYQRDDHVAGGKQVSLSVGVSPSWPPGSPYRIQYFAQECTIDYCWEMFPGYVWCDCAPSSIVTSTGAGQLPDRAFDVSVQGVARLAVDVADVTWTYSWGTCDRLELTWVPNGAYHSSQDGKLRYETPTEVAQGVGKDDSWSAGVTGRACGIALTADLAPMASVQRSQWVNMTRTPKP